jgi:hypothetical protein
MVKATSRAQQNSNSIKKIMTPSIGKEQNVLKVSLPINLKNEPEQIAIFERACNGDEAAQEAIKVIFASVINRYMEFNVPCNWISKELKLDFYPMNIKVCPPEPPKEDRWNNEEIVLL